MDVGRPYRAIAPSLEGDVLVVLAGTTRPLTSRSIWKQVDDASDRGVRLALGRLVEQGIVEAVDAPPARLYTLNREHVAAPLAEQAPALRRELFKTAQARVRELGPRPGARVAFRVCWRGDGGPESDIDLLIIRPEEVDAEDERWRGQMDRLRDRVRHWTGKDRGIAELDETELPELVADPPPVFVDIERDAVNLAGVPVQRLLAGGPSAGERP